MSKSLDNLILLIVCTILLGCQSTPQTTAEQVRTTPLSSPHKIQKIAVFALPYSQNPREFPDNKVENITIQTLMNKGYHISSRSDLDKILTEQRIHKDQLTETNAVALGKILEVDAIFIFELTDLEMNYSPERGGQYVSNVSITGRVLSVADARVIWIENSSTPQENLIEAVLMLPIKILMMSHNQDKVEEKVIEILNKFPEAK